MALLLPRPRYFTPIALSLQRAKLIIFIIDKKNRLKKIPLKARLFHLRLRCILNERGIFIVKTMGVWLVYFVDFQQNKCL